MVERSPNKNFRPKMKDLKERSIGELASLFKTTIEKRQAENPHLGPYLLFKSIVSEISLKAPIEIQQKALADARSQDKDTHLAGQNTLLFLNMKTILRVVDSVFAEGKDTQEDREEMFNSAIAYVIEKMSGIDIKKPHQIHARMNTLAYSGVLMHLCKKYDIPLTLLNCDKRGVKQATLLVGKIENFLEENIRISNNEEIERFARELSRKMNIRVSVFLTFFKERLALLETETSSDTVEMTKQNELRVEVREVLDTLTDRQKGFIELQYGFANGKERTCEEIAREFNVTPSRIYQLKEKSFRRLRGPTISRRLKDYV